MSFCPVKRAFRTVSHVIFDLDGLLLGALESYLSFSKSIYFLLKAYKRILPYIARDTEIIYQQAISDIFKKHNKVYTRRLKRKIMGMPSKEFSRILIAEMKVSMTPKAFLKEFWRLSNMRLPNVKLMPGAERLVNHLYNTRVPMAVATSSSKRSFEFKTQNFKELFSLFSHVVCGGTDPEVKVGKPHPDVYLVCTSRFADKPKPEKCLAFEDTINGVIAARKAGMQCIMIPDSSIVEHVDEATLILKSLEDFRPELFGLQPFR